MHVTYNEVKAICVMANGGTGSNAPIYSVGRLAEVARWELKYNNRWEEQLAPYLQGVC